MGYVGNSSLISLASVQSVSQGLSGKKVKQTVIVWSLCSYSQPETMRGESLVVQQ